MRRTLYVTDRDHWREWLATHHQSESEVWLIYYKKESGRPRIPYDHAVEEALCFGWIDSIVKRIDDEQFAQKFTPRRDRSRWSALNKRRLRTLIEAGRMTEAGLARIDPATRAEVTGRGSSSTNADVPPFVERGLRRNATAWKNFQALTPARRSAYVRLIIDAKREETRERRLNEAISLLARSSGDPDDLPPFVRQGLKANAKAWKNFQNLAPSYRRHYVGWIMHAKKDETRVRRLREAISLLERNEKLGLK